MEALVERAGSAAPPSPQRVWQAEGERVPADAPPRRPGKLARRLTRSVNFALALVALMRTMLVTLNAMLKARTTGKAQGKRDRNNGC